MPASSQASSELSTASLMLVSKALVGLSNPNRCRFLVKNSLTEISLWLAAMLWAVARRRGLGWAFLALIGADSRTPGAEAQPLPMEGDRGTRDRHRVQFSTWVTMDVFRLRLTPQPREVIL